MSMIGLLKIFGRMCKMATSMRWAVYANVGAILKKIGVPRKQLRWCHEDRYFKRLQSKKNRKTWYFAFFKSGRHRLPGWMEYCMRGNYSHVIAFSQVSNFVQVLDPIHSHMEVGLRHHPEGIEHALSADWIALDFSLNGGDVVKIDWDVDATHTSHHPTNFFPGCVTLAKGLLGVSDWVFTPYQFYQWLLEHGGKPLTEDKRNALLEAFVGHPLTEEDRQNIFRHLRSSAMGKPNSSAGQEKRLKEQETKAAAEAAKLEAENKRKADADARRRLGRSSLITTSELGVSDSLG